VRIALVCPYDWAKPGGVRAHVANLATFLYAEHDLCIVAPMSAPPDEPLASTVTSAGRPVRVPYNRSVAPVSLSPAAGRRALRAIEQFDPGVVHVHEPFSSTMPAIVAAFGERPTIATFHMWSERSRLYRAVAPIARRVARRLAGRIAVSPAAQEFAAQMLGMPRGAFRVIPNGVDEDAFATAKPIDDLVDPDRPLLLFVGRLEPRKGLDVLIRAYLRLRAELPRVRLCVVGEGPERERCQRMVPPSIRPDVLFVGAVSRDDLPRYHVSADLFVSPATGGESFGIVLLEAMAAGLPVVASDIPGYRTVMRDGRQGRLVPPGDAFALAEAIGTLLGNERLCRAMAAEGRGTAAEYAWPIIGRRIEEVYRDALVQ
jgi:phosphatidyl-myo-inositol alpha-mannosyltransferase